MRHDKIVLICFFVDIEFRIFNSFIIVSMHKRYRLRNPNNVVVVVEEEGEDEGEKVYAEWDPKGTRKVSRSFPWIT